MIAISKIPSILKSNARSMLTTQKICIRRNQIEIEQDLLRLDPVQVKLLDEVCIEVNEDDQVIGPRTKKDCHLMENINKGLIHRAFSVFLFNSKGEFLLQQRSDSKITFPGFYSNTCCSHPLYNDSELEENEGMGAKKAAQRRLHIELGIHPDIINIDEFQFMTRIKYAKSSDDKWGEREISYLLFVQKDVDINPNPNEIKDCIYISKEKLMDFLGKAEKKDHKITPWFQLIVDKLLFHYWDNLKKLKPLQDHKNIYDLQAYK